MEKKYKFLFFAALCTLTSQAQIFFNNGAQIWTGPQSIIQINGGIRNDNGTAPGNMDHNGDMTVTVNSALPNPGDVILANGTSVWQGDGIIRVEGDWVNDAIFQQDLSDVRLYASNNPQQITGTVVTTFHILRLSGTGTGLNRIKTQTLDANVDNLLELNDRELATQTFQMFVTDPSINAVTNITTTMGQEGFVSSLAPGVLRRATNTTSGYLFPTGSSLVLTRYRPIVITPTNTSSNEYTVRFINHDSDNDGFLRTQNDGLMCTTIDTFYHAILRPIGTTPADITIAYDPPSDGTWDGMAHWRTTNVMWNDMATTTPGTLGNYTTLVRPNWLFANPGEPYLLTELKPAAPLLTCPGTICGGSLSNLFFASGSATNYTWTVNNGTIVSGQGTDSIMVNWGGTSGYVTVTGTSPSGCPSLPDSCFVTVAPSPIAGFDTSAIGLYSPVYAFSDTSVNASTWYWDFGDGSTSNQQNPNHQYGGAGTYTVTLIVTNSNGCVDTITSVIVVPEGILIPNVFTPDGDGINDEFYIPNSGMEEYRIQIYNRWGTLVFEAAADEIRWDGHNTSGVLCSDGTYYFVLKAVLKTQTGPKDYSQAGYVSLLTKKQ